MQPPPEAMLQLAAFNQRIHNAGFKAQNYDKGFDRFVRNFKPAAEMQATVSIVKGFHAGHGTAVYYTQGKRRCILLDTTYGLSDDEALWLTLTSWASFQPHRFQPRQTPGPLDYPAEFSHVFEKHWDY
jgi:hypothetical protein